MTLTLARLQQLKRQAGATSARSGRPPAAGQEPAHGGGRGALHVHVDVQVPVALDDEQAELLRECLKTLPQREIDLLNYAYTLELSSKEITRLTGLAPGNVRQILTRARRKVLAAYIEKGGMNHE